MRILTWRKNGSSILLSTVSFQPTALGVDSNPSNPLQSQAAPGGGGGGGGGPQKSRYVPPHLRGKGGKEIPPRALSFMMKSYLLNQEPVARTTSGRKEVAAAEVKAIHCDYM